MKITFICGSLEPGRDGVGDYTIRLVSELAQQDNQVAVIALYDKFTKQIWRGELLVGDTSILLTRVPYLTSSKMRTTIFRNWIDENKPDWVSLQYVGFAYQKYGIPIQLIRLLRTLPGDVNLHIMFHELWCGMAKTSGSKERVLGHAQKIFVNYLLWHLKPHAISTSIKPYAKLLAKIGKNPVIVPIFGNIPLNDEVTEEDWFAFLSKKRLDEIVENGYLKLGFFGSIYPCRGLNKLIDDANKAAKKLNLRLAIIAIGHGRGQAVQDLCNEFPEIVIIQTGMLQSNMVNRVMRLVDLGVTTSPVDGIDKSGGAIGWMERGIPILYSEEDLSGEDKLELLGVYRVTDDDKVIDAFKRRGTLPSKSRIEAVTAEYIKMFEISTPSNVV